MDFDLRLKALTRLAQSETEAANTALRKELDKVSASLGGDNQYENLEQNLELLDAIGYRFSKVAVETLLTFIPTIESREITYSQQDPIVESEIRRYRNASSLIVRAIEGLIRLRYLETQSILRALIGLSQHTSDNIRKKAVEGLKALAEYNIHVFYGDGKQAGIGATPQKEIIDELERLTGVDLKKYFSAVLLLVEGLLSPTIEGTSWSYKSVTFSQGATPGLPDVADIRLRSIRLLKQMYGIAKTVSDKLEVVGALNDAARKHVGGKGNEDTSKMVVRDTIEVLEFFADLIETEDLQIIQKIESNSYWIFFRAIRSEIEKAALAVETAIANHSEYQIYKILIGFEGIFGDWSDLRKTDSHWEDAEKLRLAKASEYAAGINSPNYPEWRERILKFAQTQSQDLATFPVFYHFLELFAGAQPKLALQLVADDSEQIKNFLIPLLRSLGGGPEKQAARKLVESWVGQGRYLAQSTKQFLRNDNLDRDLLTTLLRRATELEDLETVALVISIAVSNYSVDKGFLISEFFLPALEVLTKHSNTKWVFDIWFRRETKLALSNLNENGLVLVLRNLLNLEKIDYHAEEILYLIAQQEPEHVLQFLCQRLIADSQKSQGERRIFDAIPYELHKLQEPLSRIPREAIRVIRDQYDGDYSMLIFRGAHLLQTIFPQFPSEFEAELLKIVKAGGESNFEFVLAVLRNYEGQPFIHRVCKEIIRSVPSDSPFRTEVAIALESTGVVMGEFGLAEAYEQKASELKDWLTDPDEKIQEFAKWYIANLERMSSADRKRAEEEIALRKFQYGEE